MRKLGGLRPWAWSPDASALFKDLAGDVSPNVPWQWREPLPPEWLSKEIGIRLEKVLGLSDTVKLYRDADEAWEAIEARLDASQVLAKALFSRAGQGHKRINRDSPGEATRNWLRNTIAAHGGVTIEPWLERVTDFSALYEMDATGGVELIGLTVIENDAAGRYTGTRVGPKWANLLPPEVAAFLEWLKTDYDLGRGHGMALYHVLKNGAQISAKHVGTTGSHRDESTTLRLDGIANR